MHTNVTGQSDRAVLVVGPSPKMLGGMASVVEQTLSMSYAGRYRAELFPITMRGDAPESYGKRLGRHMGHIARFRTTVRTLRPAVVHIHTCSGFSLYRSAVDMHVAHRATCPVVLHIHGAGFDSFYARSNIICKRIIRSVLTRADAVVALSQEWQSKLHAMATDARIVVVENAIAAPESLASTTMPGPCHFVLLAKMDDWKGIDDLLDACMQLRQRGVPAQITLAGPAGSAGDANILGNKISTRGLAELVTYIGPVRGEAKHDLLTSADAYVQPSHQEGMPISLLEAMAYELPVVATRVGGIPEMFNDNHAGLLVDAHAPGQLADAMAHLAKSASVRADMSLAARHAAATRFGIRRFEQDLVALYDQLLASDCQGAVATPLRA